MTAKAEVVKRRRKQCTVTHPADPYGKPCRLKHFSDSEKNPIGLHCKFELGRVRVWAGSKDPRWDRMGDMTPMGVWLGRTAYPLEFAMTGEFLTIPDTW